MNKWISIKEKLPENEQIVLCYAKSKDGKFNSIVECSYSLCHENMNPFAVKIFCEGNYYVRLEKNLIKNPESIDSHFYFGEVTHWMPLPKPPEVAIDIAETNELLTGILMK